MSADDDVPVDLVAIAAVEREAAPCPAAVKANRAVGSINHTTHRQHNHEANYYYYRQGGAKNANGTTQLHLGLASSRNQTIRLLTFPLRQFPDAV